MILRKVRKVRKVYSLGLRKKHKFGDGWRSAIFDQVLRVIERARAASVSDDVWNE
jgi:hypothetical protein